MLVLKKKKKAIILNGIRRSEDFFVVWPYKRLCQKGESDSYKLRGQSNVPNWPRNKFFFFLFGSLHHS